METRVQGLGFMGDNGKENGNYCNLLLYIRGLVGILEKKMETTVLELSSDALLASPKMQDAVFKASRLRSALWST